MAGKRAFTPAGNTTQHQSPDRRQTIVSLVSFPSPSSSPSSSISAPTHVPAPPCSILLDNVPGRTLLDKRSSAGPVDPYDATLWHPGSHPSVPIRARDGEFERFVRDENGLLGIDDPTSYLALLMRLKRDVNRGKSCCIAWERAEDININTQFAMQPLVDLINFRNDIAILRSNSNYSRRDIIGALSGITHFHTQPFESDFAAIKASHTVVTTLGDVMLEMENLIAHLDAIVEHSRDQHLHVKSKHAQAMEDSVVLAVMLDEGSGDEGSGDEGSVAAEVGDLSARQPNHEGIIDLSNFD